MSPGIERGYRSGSLWFARALALLSTLGNVGFNIASERLRLPGESLVVVTNRYPTLFRPANYAFAIWSVIYLATIAYALYALLPGQRRVRIHDRIAPWLIATNVFESLWVLAFRQDEPLVALGVILAALLSASMMYVEANAFVEQRNSKFAARVPFSLTLGWLSLATMSNASIALVSLGWFGAPFAEGFWLVALLVLAVVLTGYIALNFSDGLLPLVVAWGTSAIALTNLPRAPSLAWAAMLAAFVCLLFAIRQVFANAHRTLRPARR